MKFLNFFLLLWVIFALMDPDSEYGYGSVSTDLIESGSGFETLLADWFTMLFRPLVSHAGVLQVVVELITGVAEIFGTEMVLHTKYHFGHGAKIAVFTYHGCTVQVGNDTCSFVHL
jgi:hypothetical protein